MKSFMFTAWQGYCELDDSTPQEQQLESLTRLIRKEFKANTLLSEAEIEPYVEKYTRMQTSLIDAEVPEEYENLRWYVVDQIGAELVKITKTS